MNWQRLKWQLLAIVTPRCWQRLGPTDIQWDKRLWDNLTTRGVYVADYHLARVGEDTVWIGNFPYASGARYTGDFLIDSAAHQPLCTRATALFLEHSLAATRVMMTLQGITREDASDILFDRRPCTEFFTKRK